VARAGERDLARAGNVPLHQVGGDEELLIARRSEATVETLGSHMRRVAP